MPSVRGYRDLQRVGRGGFSVVYRATQESLDRSVAVKVLLTDLSDPADARRFTHECQVLGCLGAHRHVVDVHDAGVTGDGRPFIVMKFYGRGTLADRLRISGPLPVDDVIDIGIKIASALQAAHDIGVIHRDVKPENILVDDDGEPVLTDFGVAAVADAAGGYTSSIAFSRAHVAPEVLDRNDFGTPSDIYSLGSTLYTLLAGTPAFTADTEPRQVLAILNDQPPPIGRDDVPLHVSTAIAGAMAKHPGDRPASASDLGAALRATRLDSRTRRERPPTGVADQDAIADSVVQPALQEPQAGWYSDPQDTTKWRWWNGTSWADPLDPVPTGPHNAPNRSSTTARLRPRRRWAIGSVAALLVLVVAGIITGVTAVVKSQRTIDARNLESRISADLSQQAGMPVTISCPSGQPARPGTVFQCSATAGSEETTLKIVVSSDQGDVSWTVLG